MSTTLQPYVLFGSTKPWLPPPWTTTDDRLRGGASQSHLSALPGNSARFHGHLDTSTLGGAGFASQFSPPPTGDAAGGTSEKGGDENAAGEGGEEEERSWDLSAYDGVEVLVGGEEGGDGGGKVYTLILKDEAGAGKREDGRERAGVSWEVDFRVGGGEEGRGERDGGGGGEASAVWAPWGEFKATYRGKEMEGAGELRTGEVRRIGFMMRSYFGKQEGEFSLVLRSICARKKTKEEDEGSKAVKAVGRLSGSIPKNTDSAGQRARKSRGAGWFEWCSGWL
ncbi:complex I intermediate-associated protein 30-domain-containing protein [Usnea florida]